MKMYINTMKCLIFIMAFSVSSCEPISPFIIITSDDKPDARSDDTLQDTITYNTPIDYYSIPDNLRNNKSINQMLWEFNVDSTIAKKHATSIYLSGNQVIYLSGVKNKHLWLKIINVNPVNVITEYCSPDTIIDYYSEDIGYGMKRGVMFGDYLDHIYLYEYNRINDSEIIHVQLTGPPASWDADDRIQINSNTLSGASKLTIQSGSKYRSFYYEHTIKYALGYNSVFYLDVCYDYSGDTLYVVCPECKGYIGDYLADNPAHRYAFVSQEDILIIDADNKGIGLIRRSLKTNETFWRLQKNIEHPLSSNGYSIQIKYTIINKKDNVWEIQWLATNYSGERIQYSTELDVNNPPDELTITEEELK